MPRIWKRCRCLNGTLGRHSLQIILLLGVAPLVVRAGAFSIRWQTNSVEAIGFSSGTRRETDWQKVFPVFVEQAGNRADQDVPPISGAYAFKNGILRFTPEFPFGAGVMYRAVLRASETTLSSSQRFESPALHSTTKVAAIYPTVDTLPENLLKFYLQFSAPMSGGHIYEHIHLRDEIGKEVQLPFLEIDEELWDPTMTRLTLFLDPGRIKRGVRPLEEIGPALQSGRNYTLTIARDWHDATGAPLVEDFKKAFAVTPPDREPPNPLRWKISPPKAKSRDALTVVFDEPIDHALALRILRVVDSNRKPVEGSVKMDGTDRSWSFTPKEPWEKGTHKLIVPTIIEDLAGNNVGKPFDVDLQENPHVPTNEVVQVSFTIR